MPKEEVESLFDSYEDSDFSRIESTAVEKVELKIGLLEQFTHEMEPLLGKQGTTWCWSCYSQMDVSVIDQNPAQKNVYQNQGVSFPDSCWTEHDAMQRKLKAWQNEDKLTIWGINSQNARDF